MPHPAPFQSQPCQFALDFGLFALLLIVIAATQGHDWRSKVINLFNGLFEYARDFEFVHGLLFTRGNSLRLTAHIYPSVLDAYVSVALVVLDDKWPAILGTLDAFAERLRPLGTAAGRLLAQSTVHTIVVGEAIARQLYAATCSLLGTARGLLVHSMTRAMVVGEAVLHYATFLNDSYFKLMVIAWRDLASLAKFPSHAPRAKSPLVTTAVILPALQHLITASNDYPIADDTNVHHSASLDRDDTTVSLSMTDVASPVFLSHDDAINSPSSVSSPMNEQVYSPSPSVTSGDTKETPYFTPRLRCVSQDSTASTGIGLGILMPISTEEQYPDAESFLDSGSQSDASGLLMLDVSPSSSIIVELTMGEAEGEDLCTPGSAPHVSEDEALLDLARAANVPLPQSPLDLVDSTIFSGIGMKAIAVPRASPALSIVSPDSSPVVGSMTPMSPLAFHPRSPLDQLAEDFADYSIQDPSVFSPSPTVEDITEELASFTFGDSHSVLLPPTSDNIVPEQSLLKNIPVGASIRETRTTIAVPAFSLWEEIREPNVAVPDTPDLPSSSAPSSPATESSSPTSLVVPSLWTSIREGASLLASPALSCPSTTWSPVIGCTAATSPLMPCDSWALASLAVALKRIKIHERNAKPDAVRMNVDDDAAMDENTIMASGMDNKGVVMTDEAHGMDVDGQTAVLSMQVDLDDSMEPMTTPDADEEMADPEAHEVIADIDMDVSATIAKPGPDEDAVMEELTPGRNSSSVPASRKTGAMRYVMRGMDHPSVRDANLGSGSQLNALSASSAFSSAPGSTRTTNAPQSNSAARVDTSSTVARLHHYVYRHGDKLYRVALPIAPTSVCPRMTEILKIAPRALLTAPSGQSSSSARGGSQVASVTNRMTPSSHPAQRQDVSTPAGLSSSMHAPTHKRLAFVAADGIRSSSDPSPRVVAPSTSSAPRFHPVSTQGSSRGLEGSIWARGAEQPQPRPVKKMPSGSKRGSGSSRPGVAAQFVFGALPGRVNNVGAGRHLSMQAQR